MVWYGMLCYGMVWYGVARDAKTYQFANNVGVKNPISGKIFAKFDAVFDKKVSNVAISRFLANTSGNFVLLCGIFFATLCYFMALFALFWSFGPFTQFCWEFF